MRRIVCFLIIVNVLLLGCASQREGIRKEYGPEEVLTEQEVWVKGRLGRKRVVSLLQQVFAKETIRGSGFYQHERKSTAREIALNLAINDLARKAGEVVQESDSTIIQQLGKDKVLNVLKTRSMNIVCGYKIESEDWDPQTNTYEVDIAIETQRLAEQTYEQIVGARQRTIYRND